MRRRSRRAVLLFGLAAVVLLPAVPASAATPLAPVLRVHAPEAMLDATVALDEVQLSWTGGPRPDDAKPALLEGASPLATDRAGARIRLHGVADLAGLLDRARALRAANPGADVRVVVYQANRTRSAKTRRLLSDEVWVVAGDGTRRVERAGDPLASLELAARLAGQPGVRSAVPGAGISDALARRIARRQANPVKSFDKPAEAQDFFALKRVPPGESAIPVERYAQARAQMRGMPIHSTVTGSLHPSASELGVDFDVAAVTLGAWTPLGPGNIGGRTRGLVIHPTTPDTMYAGGVAGGVWKTTNGGAAWAPLTDMQPNLAVTTLAFDPTNPNTVYAGTGEGLFNGDAVRGAGIFKTTDAGTTWTRLPSTANSNFFFVNKLVALSNTTLLAATRTGLFRSTNAGGTWAQVINASAVNGCLDIAEASTYVLVSCGTFAQGAVHRSVNGGLSFTPVLATAGQGRTTVAIARANESVAYALASSIVNGTFFLGLQAVYRSTDGGVSWTVVNGNASPTVLNRLLLSNPAVAIPCPVFGLDSPLFLNQGWYDNVIAVDPADPTGNRVWAGGIDLFRSDDGGVTWGQASHWWAEPATSYAHADQHAIVFHPDYDGTTNQTLFVGSDGGVFRTTSARASTVFNSSPGGSRARAIRRTRG